MDKIPCLPLSKRSHLVLADPFQLDVETHVFRNGLENLHAGRRERRWVSFSIEWGNAVREQEPGSEEEEFTWESDGNGWCSSTSSPSSRTSEPQRKEKHRR